MASDTVEERLSKLEAKVALLMSEKPEVKMLSKLKEEFSQERRIIIVSFAITKERVVALWAGLCDWRKGTC